MTLTWPGLTTPDYWDCQCDEDYIRPYAQSTCPVCGADRDESPDSMVDEVNQAKEEGRL